MLCYVTDLGAIYHKNVYSHSRFVRGKANTATHSIPNKVSVTQLSYLQHEQWSCRAVNLFGVAVQSLTGILIARFRERRENCRLADLLIARLVHRPVDVLLQ